jgi:hypothetical protein
MAFHWWVEVETEFRPDPNQTQVPGTEPKAPQRVRPEIAKFESLAIAVHSVKDIMAHYYPKGSTLFIFHKEKGVPTEDFRMDTKGAKYKP